MTKQALKKFAVFDIDGTVARTALFEQIVRELIGRRILPADTEEQIDAHWLRYFHREHHDAHEDYTGHLIHIFEKNLAGMDVATYRKVVDDIIEKNKFATYVYTRDLARSLKAKGYTIVALSGSEMYSVQQFCAHHGFDIAIGETYEETDGHFTKVAFSVLRRKGERLREMMEQHGLTLTDSIAVGDTHGDITMLELVENPIAFNPSHELYETARKHGWKIVVERKNVVYELKPEKGLYTLREIS